MKDGGTRIRVKVTPGADRTELIGWHGDAWRIRVASAPERGRANDAALRLLAETLSVPRRNLSVVTGHTARVKLVAADGITAAEAEAQAAQERDAMTVDVERFRGRLLEERQRVQDAMQYIHDEHPDDERRDPEPRPTSTSMRQRRAYDRAGDRRHARRRTRSNVLAEIDAALERIDAGTYGNCANCGAEIPTERLEALPYATLCIDCKRREGER